MFWIWPILHYMLIWAADGVFLQHRHMTFKPPAARITYSSRVRSLVQAGLTAPQRFYTSTCSPRRRRSRVVSSSTQMFSFLRQNCQIHLLQIISKCLNTPSVCQRTDITSFIRLHTSWRSLNIQRPRPRRYMKLCWVSQEVFWFISTLEIKTWEKLKALCFFSEWKDFPSWGTSLKTSGVVLHVKPHRQMFLFSNSYFISSKANCSCDVTFWLNCSVGRFLSLSEFILFGDVF